MNGQYQLRHAGSPRLIDGLSAPQVVEGLQDGRWESTAEVRVRGETAWQPLETHPHFAEIVEELETPPARRPEEPTTLDMNALIDVCLVLLIFFILTATYAFAVQKVVPLPETKKEGKGIRKVAAGEAKNMVRIKAFRDGAGRLSILVQNTTRDVIDKDGGVDRNRLTEELSRETKGDVLRTEVLLEAEDITWGEFIAIQDAARAAGIDRILHVTKD